MKKMFIESFEQNITPQDLRHEEAAYHEDFVPVPLNLQKGAKKWGSKNSLISGKSGNSSDNLTAREDAAAYELEAELQRLEEERAVGSSYTLNRRVIEHQQFETPGGQEQILG